MAPALLVMSAAASVSLATTLMAPTVGAQPPYPTDDRGFVESAVRCEAPQSAVVFGRTEQSLVAICVDPSGHYEYRGARVGDDTVLTVVAEPTVPGEFFAQKDGVTYTVTAQELVINSDAFVGSEPMVQFGAPPLLAVEVPTPTAG